MSFLTEDERMSTPSIHVTMDPDGSCSTFMDGIDPPSIAETRPVTRQAPARRRGATIVAISSSEGQSFMLQTKALMEIRAKNSQKYIEDQERKREVRAKALWDYIETTMEQDLQKKRREYAEKVVKQRQAIQAHTEEFEKKLQARESESRLQKQMARKQKFEKLVSISRMKNRRNYQEDSHLNDTQVQKIHSSHMDKQAQTAADHVAVDSRMKSLRIRVLNNPDQKNLDSPKTSVTSRRMDGLDQSFTTSLRSSRTGSTYASTNVFDQLSNSGVPLTDDLHNKNNEGNGDAESDSDHLFKGQVYLKQAQELYAHRHQEERKHDAILRRRKAIQDMLEKHKAKSNGVSKTVGSLCHAEKPSASDQIHETPMRRHWSLPKFANEQEYMQFKERYQNAGDSPFGKFRFSKDEEDRMLKKSLDHVRKKAARKVKQKNIMFETAEKNKAKLLNILSGKPNPLGIVSSISRGWKRRHIHAITDADPAWNPSELDDNFDIGMLSEDPSLLAEESSIHRDSAKFSDSTKPTTSGSIGKNDTLSSSLAKSEYAHIVAKSDTLRADANTLTPDMAVFSHSVTTQDGLPSPDTRPPSNTSNQKDSKKQETDAQVISAATSRLTQSRHGHFAYHIRRAMSEVRRGTKSPDMILGDQEAIDETNSPERLIQPTQSVNSKGEIVPTAGIDKSASLAADHHTRASSRTPLLGRTTRAKSIAPSSPMKEKLDNSVEQQKCDSPGEAKSTPEKIIIPRVKEGHVHGLEPELQPPKAYRLLPQPDPEQLRIHSLQRPENLARPPWTHLSILAVSEFTKTIPSKSLFSDNAGGRQSEFKLERAQSSTRHTSDSWLHQYEKQYRPTLYNIRDVGQEAVSNTKRTLLDVATQESIRQYEMQKTIIHEIDHIRAQKVLCSSKLKFWIQDNQKSQMFETD